MQISPTVARTLDSTPEIDVSSVYRRRRLVSILLDHSTDAPVSYLINITARKVFQLPRTRLCDKRQRLVIRLLDKSILLSTQVLSRGHVADTDRKPVIGCKNISARGPIISVTKEKQRTEPPGTNFRQLVHRIRRLHRTIVPQYNTKDRVLLAVSNGRLVKDAAHNLAVLDHQIPVVGRHVGNFSWARLLHCPALRFEVHEDLALLVWPHEQIEHLLACPQRDWTEDGGRRDIVVFLGISEVRQDLNELSPSEEAVLAREEEGASDEVLGRSDDGLAVAGRDQVLLDVEQLTRFGARFLGLRNVCGGFVKKDLLEKIKVFAYVGSSHRRQSRHCTYNGC
jgi:hypothetical protein